MKRICIVLLTLALCGCATSREVYTADGAMVYAIDCYAQTSAACTEKAGEICGMLGYRFVRQDGTPLPPPAPTPPPAPDSTSASASTPAVTHPADDSDSVLAKLKTIRIDRKMYIQCQV
jgi:hypothetical protein